MHVETFIIKSVIPAGSSISLVYFVYRLTLYVRVGIPNVAFTIRRADLASHNYRQTTYLVLHFVYALS